MNSKEKQIEMYMKAYQIACAELVRCKATYENPYGIGQAVAYCGDKLPTVYCAETADEISEYILNKVKNCRRKQ